MGAKVITALGAMLGAAFRKQWLPLSRMQSLLNLQHGGPIDFSAAVAKIVAQHYTDGWTPGQHHSGLQHKLMPSPGIM